MSLCCMHSSVSSFFYTIRSLRDLSIVMTVQFAQLCPALHDPMDCSTPGLPVHHQLLDLAQTHVHWVSDAIQPSHPLSPLFLLPSIFLSIKVFPSESVLHIRGPKHWSFSFTISPSNERSGLISFRTDKFDFLDHPSFDSSIIPVYQEFIFFFLISVVFHCMNKLQVLNSCLLPCVYLWVDICACFCWV